MSRLIDADKLKAIFTDERHPCELQYVLLKTIDDQPTAYDVDSVLRKLEDEGNQSYTDFEKYADNIGLTDDDDWHYMGLKRAIEIVRGCLVEGNE